jgi:hypothetical protein
MLKKKKKKKKKKRNYGQDLNYRLHSESSVDEAHIRCNSAA